LSLQPTLSAILALSILPLAGCQHPATPATASGPIKVVVITGGHDFEEQPFREMFAGFQGMAVTYAPQPDDSDTFEDIHGWDYDVIVLYNMSQKISPLRQKNFDRLIAKGVGVVAVHHALAAFQEWDGYSRIVGGKYFLSDQSFQGRPYKQSTYKHDERIQVRVADPLHPVTQGIRDFEILDEAYKGYAVAPGSHVLLTTDHPLSEKAIAWTRHEGPSRVVYVELGHDGRAYGNESYRRFLRQAIVWCSKRAKE
jgi:uncharacterized protein